MKLTAKDVKLANFRAAHDLKYFLKYFWYPYFENEPFQLPTHQANWADVIQNNPNKHIVIVCARNHGKTCFVCGVFAWDIFRTGKPIELMYVGGNKPMAITHLTKLKNGIRKNPIFQLNNIKDISESSHKITIRKPIDKNNTIISTITAYGFMEIMRGLRADRIALDDVMVDEKNKLRVPVNRDKAEQKVMTEILPIPKIDPITKMEGQIIMIGTPQFSDDIYTTLAEKHYPKKFVKIVDKAIINRDKKEVLWPELRGWDWLMDRRGETAMSKRVFQSEYQCQPMKIANTYIEWEDLEKCLFNEKDWSSKTFSKPINLTENIVFGGLDLGKKVHPSHLSVFEYDQKTGTIKQLINKFWWNTEYIRQLGDIKDLIHEYNIQMIYYDNSRGELETEKEIGNVPPIMIEKSLQKKTRNAMVDAIGSVMNDSRYQLKIINDDNQIGSLNSVTLKAGSAGDLNSQASNIEVDSNSYGHGDAFFSLALAMLCFLENNIASNKSDSSNTGLTMV